MQVALLFLFISGLVPIWLNLRANRTTTLRHAAWWTGVAWIAWMLALLMASSQDGLEPWRFTALCLTGCAGVAVFGARRPHVAAWDFVVSGLFAVMMLPLAEGLFFGFPSLDPVRTFFLIATLAVICLNYLPTRFCVAAMLAAVALALQLGLTLRPEMLADKSELLSLAGFLLLSLVPWIALKSSRDKQSANRSEFDRVWLDFRNRYGFLWASRVREQFNRSAHHAGWSARLSWQGLGATDVTEAVQQEMLKTLSALLRRFRSDVNDLDIGLTS